MVNRVMSLLVSGLILLLVSNSPANEHSPCGDGFGSKGDAQICFDNHVLLSFALRKADNGEILRNGYVQKSFEDYPHIKAVAIISAGQACVVKFAAESLAVYVSGGKLIDRFIDHFVESLIPLITEAAKNDCLIEIHSKNGGKLNYGLVDFVNQSPIDGIADGALIVESEEKKVLIKPALYFKHADKKKYSKLFWDHNAFVFLAKSISANELYQIAPNGFVTKDNAGVYTATYIFDDMNYSSFKICSQSQLRQRYVNPIGPLAELVQYSDAEIAIRAIPGAWFQPLNMDPTAYVLCD